MAKGKGTKEYGEAVEDYIDHTFGDIMCESCKHYHGDNTCEAYQTQIPIEIVSGRVLHILPYEGDNGIQYERKS